MGYNKNGSFTLNKNTNKIKTTQPDYRGSGLDLEGKPIWISAWVRTDPESGKEFFSCAIQYKEDGKTYVKQDSDQGASPATHKLAGKGYDDITF